MAKPAVAGHSILNWENGQWKETNDLTAAEEPMEIRLEWGPEHDRREKAISITMRTPGNDFELAVGFLFTEGIIRQAADILSVRYCTTVSTAEAAENIVRVRLHPDCVIDISSLERHFYATSSCGVCGKASLEALQSCKPVEEHSAADFVILPELLLQLPEQLQASQNVFRHTGGLHACAWFNPAGQLLYLREDIGRHNALDKLIGAACMDNALPLHKGILLLSGRAGFEMIQKASTAGVRIVASVGAPSGLAVAAAESCNMTLIGFLRDRRFNVYCGSQRMKR